MTSLLPYPDTFIKSAAICVRIIPFSRTSHIVSWVTPMYGLVGTVVKGARRPKSWFLGQYDLFQTCEIVFYARERNGLHILKEAALEVSRGAFRSDWQRAAQASYLCGLVTRNLFGSAAVPGCFELLSATLDVLVRSGAHRPLTFWFELQLARAMGLAPSLERCTACNRALAAAKHARFSPRRGGVLCPRCPVGPGDMPVELSPDQLAILRRLQRIAVPDRAAMIQCTEQQCLAIARILGTFVTFHLETKPSARSAAMALLARTDALTLARGE